MDDDDDDDNNDDDDSPIMHAVIHQYAMFS